MGLAATRRVRPRASGSTPRPPRAPRRSPWKPAPPRSARSRRFAVPWTMPAAAEKPAPFWSRFADDGELLPLKIGLLVVLSLVVAIIEVVA